MSLNQLPEREGSVSHSVAEALIFYHLSRQDTPPPIIHRSPGKNNTNIHKGHNTYQHLLSQLQQIFEGLDTDLLLFYFSNYSF